MIEGSQQESPQPESKTSPSAPETGVNAPARSDGRKSIWEVLPPVVTAILAVLGIALGGAISVAYVQFYEALGVDPTEVGFSYTNVLAASIGSVLMFVVLFAFAYALFEAVTPSRLAVAAASVLILLVIVLPLNARIRASEVRKGNPVLPARWGPIVLIAVRADPARVVPNAQQGTSSALNVSSNRALDKPLLYIGRTAGTIVLYDSLTQKTIHLPASDVLLERSNCAPRNSPDPVCKRARRHLVQFGGG